MKPSKKDRLSEKVKSTTTKMKAQDTASPKVIRESRDKSVVKKIKNIPGRW